MDKDLKPTVFVIFGVSGDLAQTKLLQALYNLYKGAYLPEKFHIIGISRRDWSNEQYDKYIQNAVPDVDVSFLEKNTYMRGNFDEPVLYENLAKELQKIDSVFGSCSNKLFYLAVPPVLYGNILENISNSGLSIPCGGDEGWTRILIEKPFGNDEKTAMALDARLGKLFQEEQIFRIDHYLAKETVRNILAFRFSNSLFEPLWNKKHISSIEITLLEKNGVENRGAFYDKIGALNDVGQNHILQMLALVTMEQPEAYSAESMRKERFRVLRSLNVSSPKCMIRAQYEGYKKEKGVREMSDTETFFSIRAGIKNNRFRNVPLYLTSGKSLKESRVQIDVYFKDDISKSFLPLQHQKQEQNKLTFRIQPSEGISILFWSKVPGFEHKIEPKELAFEYGNGTRKIDAYEKVLRDCVLGDQTLFAGTDEVMAQWSFIEKVKKMWTKNPLYTYSVGSDGPEVCKDFIKN